MEENKVESKAENNKDLNTESGEKFSKIDTKNLKPFLSVFIIFVIIIFGYYFFWRSVAIKMKNIITDYMKDYQYDSIEVSGFPFSKTITINNLTVSSSDIILATQNQVNIKETEISSFILSSNLDVKLKDVSVITVPDNTSYSLLFNEVPVINIGFYSNGSLKNLKYIDYGYRVVNDNNETLYTADKSEINVESLTNANKIDYSIVGSLQNMKNLSIIKTENQISETETPTAYSLDFDFSSSIASNNNEVESSVVKINTFEFKGGDNVFSASGEIFRDITDPYSFGEIKFTLTNYIKLMEIYRKNVEEALNIEFSGIQPEEREEYIKIANQMFDILNNLIKKNPETTDNIGVLDIKRTKGTQDYIVNGESLINIIQNLLSSN